MKIKGSKLGFPLKYENFLLVRIAAGRHLPIDTLRYENCRPWLGTDSAVIEKALSQHHDNPEMQCILVRYTTDADPQWMEQIWKGIGGITAVPLTRSEAEDINREREGHTDVVIKLDSVEGRLAIMERQRQR